MISFPNATILKPKKFSVPDIYKLLEETLKPFKNITARNEKVLIVVPDATRCTHLKTILPYLKARVSKKAEVIVATGLHKPLKGAELISLVGETFKATSHSQKKSDLIYLDEKMPLWLNKKTKEADCIISIGVIEPHLYAGYSGGAKTVAMGLAGEPTINFTHHPRFLDHPDVKLGKVWGNPFQETLWEIVKGLPFYFAINVVNDNLGRPIRIFAGSPGETFEEGVKFADVVFKVEARETAEVVVCEVNSPKDVNLYQASRAANHIVNVTRPIVNKGGCIVILADLPEGIGKGLGEKRFGKALRSMKNPEELIAKFKKRECLAGEHRAYMLAKAAKYAKIIFAGKNAPVCTKGASGIEGILPSGLRNVISSKSKTYVIPNTLSTIPVVGLTK